jgi:uncharacterized protein
VEHASLVETHISVLVFLGDRVYKMRKPVRTPFLDFSTRELRLADCRREVDLNRRLAPDVYLGVLDVCDEAGEPVEHLVEMRRLPAVRRLSSLVADPAFDAGELTRIARVVAAFHEQAERSAQIDRAGSVEHLSMLWETNLAETEPFLGRFLDPGTHAEAARIARAFLAGRHHLLAERVTAGRIVDGHGDLLAQDIFCLPDGPRILDCIEFDATFRWGDVLYDTAFLAMDLEHLGHPELAARFLAAYREFSAETHPTSLEHWYIAYRALVRAKIACLRADGGDEDAPAEAAALLAQSARHLAQAEAHLVLVGGLPGTGKSTVAQGIADRLGWDVLRSDEVRKELAGVVPGTHVAADPFAGLYTPATTERTYAVLLDRARIALEHGDSVVLDASWLDPSQRRAAQELARRTHATWHDLCCVVDVREAEERIRARAAHGRDPSDATPEVLAALAARSTVPWPGAVVDTGLPPAASVAVALRLVRPDLAEPSSPD